MILKIPQIQISLKPEVNFVPFYPNNLKLLFFVYNASSASSSLTPLTSRHVQRQLAPSRPVGAALTELATPTYCV